MIADFPCLRQPTGQSCLPTAVLAVLHYAGQEPITLNQVAIWCRATSGGACLWDFALDGLRQNFDIEDLEGDWEAVCEELTINGEPVIVTISHPHLPVGLLGDHAVVIVGMDMDGGQDYVQFMDPMTATIESKPLSEFLQWWDRPGQRAFVLRPV